MAKRWKLTKYQPQSFGGINESMSLVVMLDRPETVVGFTGDQGTCKTSNLNCLRTLLGGAMPANAMNEVDNGLKASCQIKLDDGRLVDASYDKNNFRVFVTQEFDGKPSRAAQSRPMEFIRDLIGPLGVSPMFLKGKDGDAQVKWLREISHLTADQVAREQEISGSYARDFKQRRDINREVKRYKGELEHSFFFDFDTENKTFVPNDMYRQTLAEKEKGAGNTEAINAKFQKASVDLADLNRYRAGKESLVDQVKEKDAAIEKTNAEIARLNKQLADQINEKVALEARIDKADEFIEALASAERDEAEARKEMLELSATQQKQAAAEADLKKSAEYARLSDQSTSLSAKLLEWQVLAKKFVQAITPDVEGIEVKIAADLDVEFEAEAFKALNPNATDKEVKAHVLALENSNVTGLFYKGRSVAQLCESELWDLCLVLWKHMGVNVIFIENVNSLGSDAVERINWFAETGLVFYSEMERGQKDLDIVFSNKIPTTTSAKSRSAKAKAEQAN